IGVVRMSRTSVDPVKALWIHRRPLQFGLGLSVLLTVLVSLFLARTITRPVREITAAAEAIARGEPRRPLRPGGSLPAELHTLSAALDSMTAQLEERADYVAEFAANISHELKTPLTAVRGAVELLRDDDGEMDAAQRERFLANIDAGAARMQRLVVRLLHLARLESRRDAAPAEEVPLRPALEALAARHPNAEVRIDATAAPATLHIPPDQLESAAGNLIDNAVRHGAGAPIEVTARAAGERVEITVTDHGPGISANNQRRLFERFFTTERDRGGTGLGLAIARAVARRRGGDLTFTTGPEGTTFTLTL
ncbi:MAG: HAMP domain-containing protein, partial [Myxococcales bacterium]|nr:HAMP domain-containing protein [Myxococcales bacterium]